MKLPLLILVASSAFGACTGTNPTWTSTPDRASVASCVSSASRGDTINVSAGSATWTSTITITKGLTVSGAGIGNTIITSGSSSILFTATPDSSAISNSENIKITGFTFDGANSTCNLLFLNGASGVSGTKPYQYYIIGNNKFQNGCTSGEGAILAGTANGNGQLRGVIYSNIFDRINIILRAFSNNDTSEWANTAFNNFTFGTINNLYFESNVIRFSSSFSGDNPGWMETGQGARIAVRYNSYDWANATTPQEIWDIHGFQNWNGSPNSGQTGTMVSEYYGNTLANATTYRWINHRGSWGMFFNNILTGSGGNSIDINQYAGCPGLISPTPTYNPLVNNTYVFNNAQNGTVKNMAFGDGTQCSVAENSNWWNYNAACTSSSCSAGIGRGIAAPTGTCTTGVGYWVAATATPTTSSSVIQAASFYKCTSTNTWTLYYRPYTYPHPLRGGGGANPTNPAAPQNIPSATRPTPTGSVIPVHSGDDLQAKYNAAACGSDLVLDSGTVFTGNFVFNKQCASPNWILVEGIGCRNGSVTIPAYVTQTTINAGTLIPPPGLTGYATIRSTNNVPPIYTTNGSNVPVKYNYFGCLEVTSTVSQGALVNLTNNLAETQISQLGDHIMFDRVYPHGIASSGSVQIGRGFLITGSYVSIVNSYVSQIYSGTDSQAILLAYGPGPYLITNNFLSASTEILMSGGTGKTPGGIVPSDITITKNYFYKLPSWNPNDPSYDGIARSSKNFLESKYGSRWNISANAFINSWDNGQADAFNFNSNDQNGDCAWCVSSDINLSNNVIKNIAGAFSIIPAQNYASTTCPGSLARVLISNNLFWVPGASPFIPSGGKIFALAGNSGTCETPGGGADSVQIIHNHILGAGVNMKLASGLSYNYTNLVIRDNITEFDQYRWTNQCPDGMPPNVDGSACILGDVSTGGLYNISNNAIINSGVLNGGQGVSDSTIINRYGGMVLPNIYDTRQSSNYAGAPFLNYGAINSDYHNWALTGSGAWRSAASDGKDPGVNFTILDAAIGGAPPPPISPCDLNADKVTNVIDVQLAVNMTLGLINCTAQINGSNVCNATTVQRVVTAALGGSCVVGP